VTIVSPPTLAVVATMLRFGSPFIVPVVREVTLRSPTLISLAVNALMNPEIDTVSVCTFKLSKLPVWPPVGVRGNKPLIVIYVVLIYI
jgi:hypothetical protein